MSLFYTLQNPILFDCNVFRKLYIVKLVVFCVHCLTDIKSSCISICKGPSPMEVLCLILSQVMFWTNEAYLRFSVTLYLWYLSSTECHHLSIANSSCSYILAVAAANEWFQIVKSWRVSRLQHLQVPYFFLNWNCELHCKVKKSKSFFFTGVV